MDGIDEQILEQADHFLNCTKHFFQNRGFLFSSAFIIGDTIDVIKLDVSTCEKKEEYSKLVKERFRQNGASHLIVIQEAWVYKLTPDEMENLDVDGCSDPKTDADATEALVVFISSRNEGEVWQVPFMKTENGVLFGEKEILKSIVSQNWMINRNQELALQLN